MTSELRQKHCESCEGIGQALQADQTLNLLSQLHEHWQVVKEHQAIRRSFSFNNFYETMAFVNAVAWIANVENHHPDLEIGYNYCHMTFTTHALNGLTTNDFICAAKVDDLLLDK
ncbi:pterin 4 alpha carbinolamine dehydratase [Legionella birminghamensis]|uniref:Putative pterin-4-alpha-carbinolamine dehydratase n=1 Tax=Legionella birminghamensis TaxID=28083 RepID=A0A378I8S8_9GAMM|nr:4a-hydroxytetrahydrobiopterin dehydratase [Legionella birminghamensis]KTC68268.1 pterin 4 alpha carbinolamine dehydratase [Legionella birminghamensis]STX31021.1 Pterin-4a-carbinolamine dehydratase [Legionella birminghamensis]